jgi:ADP-ribosylglycohydrolase
MTRVLPPAELLRVLAEVEAQRFETWPAPPQGASVLDQVRLADRVRGCLFGAALGDAAGLAAEFLGARQVADFYGPDADFAPGRDVYPDEHRMMWCAGDWTDDTDQHILVVQSLLGSGGRADPLDFAARLVRWREGGFPELGDESGAGLGRNTKAVLNDPRFLTAPHATARAHSSRVPSNGGVMRTAAAGIPFFWDGQAVAETAASLCRTTHADPRCVASCIVVATCVSRLLQGADEEGTTVGDAVAGPALERARDFLRSEGYSEAESDLAALWEHGEAAELRDLELDEVSTIGYTFKCMGAGLWALRSPRGFQETLNELIRHGGERSTGMHPRRYSNISTSRR